MNSFFQILRTALWGGSLPDGTRIDAETMRLLESHSVLGMAADVIADKLDDEHLNNIYSYMASSVRNHHLLNGVVADIVGRLAAAGIKAVLLKGQGLAALYPLPNTRHAGDVDLYVGKENYCDAMRIIDDYCGIPAREHRMEENNIHGSADKGCVHIEVHYLAADTAMPDIKCDYNAFAESRLLATADTVTINGVSVNVPDATFNAIYVFEHLLKHLRYEGVGIRQFVDWLLTLRQQPDADELEHMLRRFHLLDAWQVLGGIVVWQLGMPKEQFPLWNERKARHSQGRHLRYVIDAGNLGRGTAASKGYYYMQHSFRRQLLAARYYLRQFVFDYQLFPHDAVKRMIRRVIN